jgi:hypothetical protein
LEEARRELAACNTALSVQRVDIDPDLYEPVVPTRRLGYFRHPQLLSLCLEALCKAQQPLSTQAKSRKKPE